MLLLVSEAFVNRYFPRENPISQQISCYSRAFKANRFGPAIPRTIVGVVSDLRDLEEQAGIGVYGVAAYGVQQRVREIGIRVAIGATRADVLRVFFAQVIKPPLAGLLVGLVASLALTRIIAGLLYGVTAYDPITL